MFQTVKTNPAGTSSTTSVQEVEIDLDSWLGTPGADDVVLPPENEKPTVFSKPKDDLKFLDEEEEEEEETPEGTPAATTVIKPNELDDILAPSDEEEEEEVTTTPAKNKDQGVFAKAINKLFEEEFLLPFDDDKDISEYSEKDLHELITENFKEKERVIREETQEGFIESLPEEIKLAAKYVSEGGKDIKGMFRALAQVEETRALDPENENDQEAIVRKYYKAKNFFDSDEELENEIDSLRDLGRLEIMASKFKPGLDKMEEDQIQKTIANEELKKKKQQEASQKYVDNVFEALRSADINGIKLDKKTQSKLYTGLVQPQFDSISGKKTNMLGHLLEKYQFVEPNYPLIAEALYLLSDPNAYRGTIAKTGKDAATEETVRKLKTEQSRKSGSSTISEEEQQRPRLARPKNFLKR